MKFKFSNHSLEEIQKRKIPIELIEDVLANPQQTFSQDEEITIYQSQVTFGTDKKYLLRLFINTFLSIQKLIQKSSLPFTEPVKSPDIGEPHEN